jgi:aminoglycoside phosphotransferase (APT) family kinase protein
MDHRATVAGAVAGTKPGPPATRRICLNELGERIGAGRVAEVYAQGDNVLKLYLSPGAKAEALREAATLAALEPLGLPVPRVLATLERGGRWGLVMTKAPGQPFLEVMMRDPSAGPRQLAAMADLHAAIHAHSVRTLPGHKAKLGAAIQRAPDLGESGRARLLERLAALPSGDRVCHLDFHPANILGVPGEATVVDWLDASLGDPAADVCRTHVIIHPHFPEVADAYVAAYAGVTGMARDAVDAWRPVIAGARLAEGLPERDYLVALAAV